jgi:hypothetical protein
MPKITGLLFSFLLISFFSCQKKEEVKSTTPVSYPNQDTPLALLMREMFLDMEEIRSSVENREALKSYLDKHKDILHSIPTNPKVKTAEFQLMGKAYLESLRILENSSQELMLENYKTLVSSCLGCHKQYCPGPVKRINKLIIE